MRRRASAVPELASHNLVEVETIEAIMEKLQYRHDHRENVVADRVMDFGIRWLDQGPSQTESGYYAKIDGRDLLLTPNALKTANRLIGSQPRFWDQPQDRNAFPKMLSHILDNKENDGYMVRHNGLQVNAVLPASYIIKDANELMDDIILPLKEHVGDIKGISMIDRGDGDITSLRVIIGENIIKELRAEFGQYMMFLLNTSETGAIPTKSVLGLFRTTCTNSAIRDMTKTQEWNHKSDWDKFWDSTMQTIQQISYFSAQFGDIFTGLLQAKLEIPASDLLAAFHTEQLITHGHYDEAVNWVDQPTEDGRPVETQYDLFNVLTKAAQTLPSIAAQHRAEEAAMKIFTEPGGIGETLRKATERPRRGIGRGGRATSLN